MNRTGPGSLAWHVDRRGARRRAALRARLRDVIGALDAPPPAGSDAADLLGRLERALAGTSEHEMWLALTVLGGRLPTDRSVQAAVRTARLDGPLAALAPVLRSLRPGWPLVRGPWPDVEIVTGKVVVDVHHTAQTTFATGIQRVARQSVLRWHRDHEPIMIGWTSGYAALRRLDPPEVDRALHGGEPASGTTTSRLVVPWRCTYLLPELRAEPPQAQALQAMVAYSRCTTAVIGFDCVPVTSAETTAYGMSGGFALNLSAVARMDRVAAISHSAAAEYGGWRSMLRGAGLTGPDIAAVPLAVEAGEPTEEALARARSLLTTGGMPMVLVVGSHEPRKNHLAVLHAAELLWRDGLRFGLNFVGGNAWNSQRFTDRLGEAQAAKRPVQSISALSDELLWAAYRLARCTVFPSFNEGFGLPVAESLASGTPVITSGFGSMREIAAAGGALLVDPRDDHQLAEAMHRLLTDDGLHGRLAEQARVVPSRSWDAYADEAWRYLVDGSRPPAAAAQAAPAQTVSSCR